MKRQAIGQLSLPFLVNPPKRKRRVLSQAQLDLNAKGAQAVLAALE